MERGGDYAPPNPKRLELRMKRRYIDLEDLITRLDADIEYSKLTGRLERAQNIAEIKKIIEQVGFIDIPVKDTDTETVIYRHTGERE